MNTNNIIKILPNIYLGTNPYLSEFDNNQFGISNIIMINNPSYISTSFNQYNMENDQTQIQMSNLNIGSQIDFNQTNQMLFQIAKSGQVSLIVSENNLMGFFIVCGFMIGLLDITFIEALGLSKYYNINLAQSDPNYISQISDYYKLVEKNKNLKK